MSQQLINRSPDLKRLRDEGYDIEVRGAFLMVKRVPYVNSRKEVAYGTLVSTLALAGDVTTKPDTHVVHFAGDYPCRNDGSEIVTIRHSDGETTLDRGLVVQHSFSSKPNSGYADYYEKMTTYVAILSGPARSLDPTITATPFPVVETEEGESVFCYEDTASSRAQISAITRKLETGPVAIVGLGGTGSYVLDLVAKTPVQAIHLFDGDRFSQHNAFRSPGAASIEELRQEPQKVDYLTARYSHMHRHIIPHDGYLDASTIYQLDGMAFVFLCLDRGEAKRVIIEWLEANGTPFVDVGMGIETNGDALLGILRVTTSTPGKRDHVYAKNRIPFGGGGGDAYSRNIQIADLNALNATLAVIRWKKLLGFYTDLEGEHFCAYTIDGNHLANEDQG